jgi:predicted AAA+ superfamily ATPase
MKYARFLEGPLGFLGGSQKARLVLGARQTGKSTLFQRLRGSDGLLIDLQERSERMRLARDPGALTRALLPPGRQRRHVLIDEIQRVPELLDEIQMILDRHPGRFTFTLTGSSARRLRRSEANLLPGRVHRYRLGPVCQWEVAGRRSFAILPPPPGTPLGRFPRRPLEDLLVLGSLPAAAVEGHAFARTLESYAEAYIEEEVLRESAARSLGDYGRFLELAAVASGRPINLTGLSQDSGVAITTIRGFYGVLEDTLLGFTVPPFAHSGRARILKTPRFFLCDVGVRNALARLPLERAMLATEGGPLLEHWVACELATRIGYLGRSYRLSYWRTHDGAEVDLVLEGPREALPIEVKYTVHPRPEDAGGVERFLSRYPRWARRGLVVCRGDRAEQLTPRVRAIPWDEL